MAGEAIATRGGGWLLERPATIFTPEDVDRVTRDIREAARAFVQREVAPLVPRMEAGELDHNVTLMRKAGDLGLLAAEVPEAYGGLDLPRSVAAVIAEEMGATAGFAVTYGAHASLGTLPLVYFGTDEQKRRYLPRLACGEWIAAYALTEPGAGSDALAAATTALRSADGARWVLRGTKMWISNAAFADLFTVFAKVDGERFTAFLVERDSPGLVLGAEEHKMGIRSSSTRVLGLDGVEVPAANLLGQIGQGHKIAFGVLNVGRYKLGAGAVGAARRALELCTAYAGERRQFGRPIARFGLIRHKLGEMAARIFAAESALYRTLGLIDAEPAERSGSGALPAGIAECAVEASIVKVLATEVLDHCVDEAVQIHGGMGFSAELEIERAYRDSRINRIFEGTSEINRLLIAGMLLKRGIGEEPPSQPPQSRSGARHDPDLAAVDELKQLVRTLAGAAAQRFGTELDEEQEVLAAIADGAIGAYAAESAVLRARRLGDDAHLAMAALTLARCRAQAAGAAGAALARIAGSDQAGRTRPVEPPLAAAEPVDVIALRRRVADAVIGSGGSPSARRS